jgi:hypothetical protein
MLSYWSERCAWSSAIHGRAYEKLKTEKGEETVTVAMTMMMMMATIMTTTIMQDC